MSMSYTAPTFNPEDVENEVDQLDQAAKDQRLRDLYGKDIPIDETLELVEETLSQLQKELDLVDPREKEAYLRARNQCPEYLDSLLLPFLRADKFDAAKAAARITTYWEEKLCLFGEEHTFGPVTLNALGDSGRQVLLDGGYQILPKDDHGRAVMLADRGNVGVKKNGRDSVLRALFYILHAILEDDVSVQQRGLLIISATRSAFKMEDFDRMMMKRGYKMLAYAPIRVVAYHVVLSSSLLGFFIPSLLWLMGPEIRSHYVPHGGCSSEQLKESFSPYGVKHLPVVAGGNLRYKGEEFLSQRRRIEQQRRRV